MKRSMMPKGWCHVIDNEPQNLVGTSNALLPTFTTKITAGVVPATLNTGRVPQKRRGPHSVTLSKGGSMFAIIAIILSLVISVAPVTETLSFEAIDTQGIEMVHNSHVDDNPTIPVAAGPQTCPILKRMRTGQWNIGGGSSGDVFTGELRCGGGINSPPNIGGAVVAIAAIAAITVSALCGEGMEGVLMAGIGPVLRRWSGAAGELQTATVTYFIKGEGLKSLKVTVYDDDRDAAVRGLVSYVHTTLPEGIEKSTILEAASRMKGRNKLTGLVKETSVRGHFVCLEDVAKISKRPIKRFDIKGDVVTRRRVGQWLKKHYGDEMFAVVPIVSGEVCVVLGATFRHIAEAYDLGYSRKMVSKYLRKEILAHRMNVVEIDPTILEIIQRKLDDGFSYIEGPRKLLEEIFQGVRIPGGIGFRLFGEELDKSRNRIKVNDTLDHLVLHSDPRNNKGTLGRKVGEGVLIAYWEYEQREKPGTSGPQLLTQFAPFRKDAAGTGWAFYFVETAVACAYSSAARLVRALQGGFMDDGLIATEQSTEEAKGHAPALVKRDSFISRLLNLGLPVATSGTLMFLMERLIRSWSEKKRFAESAAEVWNITLPWSISGIVMSHSSREELGRVDWKVHNNNKVYWCPLYRELIIHDDLYENAHPMNDMGDTDGDMMFAWLVIQNGVERVLLSRHPVGTGGFQWLDPKDVHVRWQFTKWTKTNGDIVELEKLEVGDIKEAKDWKFAPVPALEDESEPSDGSHSPDEWEAILEYEEEKRVAAVILGQAINTGTWRCGHDLDFTPVETQLIADASQNAAVNLATMIYLSGLVKSMAEERLHGQELADEAMVAKFGMAKRCFKSGVRVVMSTFTALINKSVHAHRTAHEGLTKMLTTRGHDIRKTEKLHDLCLQRGLTANIESGQKLLDYVGTRLTTWTLQQNLNILKTLRAFENRDLKEVAEIVYGAYCIIEKNKDMDNSLFLFSDDSSGVSEDCIFGYLLKYLEMGHIDDNQDPNPDGDGSNDPEKGGDMDNSVGSGAMDEHTQFEMLNEKNMKELHQICKDAGLKRYSKLKKVDLIHFIIDSDDGDDGDDNNDPTPPNGGGDGPYAEVEQQQDDDRDLSALDTSQWEREQEIEVISLRGNQGIINSLDQAGHQAVYIGRQFSHQGVKYPRNLLANKFKDGTREENIANYRQWMAQELSSKSSNVSRYIELLAMRHQEMMSNTSGKKTYLGCWCAPEACHGGVVKEAILAMMKKSEDVTASAADEAGKRKEGDMNLPNVQIWCDGACRGNPGVGGWGVILDHPKKRLELCGGETNTTNNRMELTAAIEGLKALRMPAKVTVHSDSKYVVKGMAEWVAGWIKKGWRKADRKPVANKDLWIELVDLASKHEVTWEWVEGHTGDEMNEAADTLANQGADEVEQAGFCLLDLLFVVVALLFMSSVAALGGEAVFAAAPLLFRKNAMVPDCILKEAVKKAEKAAETSFRAVIKAEDKAMEAACHDVAEAIQEADAALVRCEKAWESDMDVLMEAYKDLDAGEAMTLKVTSVTKPRESTGRDRCGKRRTHRVSGNDYIVCCEGCSPGYCPKSNNLIEPGDLVAFHWIG